MVLTMALLESLEETMEQIKQRCKEIMQWKNDFCHDIYCTYGTISSVEFDACNVEITVEEYWAYGGHETHCYSFPFHEIVNDNWKETYLEHYNQECEHKKQQAQEKKVLDEKLKEEAEKEQYMRLKAKYDSL